LIHPQVAAFALFSSGCAVPAAGFPRLFPALGESSSVTFVGSGNNRIGFHGSVGNSQLFCLTITRMWVILCHKVA